MKYRIAFHIRKQPTHRLSSFSVECKSEMALGVIQTNGLWVTVDYKESTKVKDDHYWLPPHKIEYIERIEE